MAVQVVRVFARDWTQKTVSIGSSTVSVTTIIGIAVGGAVFLCAVLIAILRTYSRSRDSCSRRTARDSHSQSLDPDEVLRFNPAVAEKSKDGKSRRHILGLFGSTKRPESQKGWPNRRFSIGSGVGKTHSNAHGQVANERTMSKYSVPSRPAPESTMSPEYAKSNHLTTTNSSDSADIHVSQFTRPPRTASLYIGQSAHFVPTHEIDEVNKTSESDERASLSYYSPYRRSMTDNQLHSVLDSTLKRLQNQRTDQIPRSTSLISQTSGKAPDMDLPVLPIGVGNVENTRINSKSSDQASSPESIRRISKYDRTSNAELSRDAISDTFDRAPHTAIRDGTYDLVSISKRLSHTSGKEGSLSTISDNDTIFGRDAYKLPAKTPLTPPAPPERSRAREKEQAHLQKDPSENLSLSNMSTTESDRSIRDENQHEGMTTKQDTLNESIESTTSDAKVSNTVHSRYSTAASIPTPPSSQRRTNRGSTISPQPTNKLRPLSLVTGNQQAMARERRPKAMSSTDPFTKSPTTERPQRSLFPETSPSPIPPKQGSPKDERSQSVARRPRLALPQNSITTSEHAQHEVVANNHLILKQSFEGMTHAPDPDHTLTASPTSIYSRSFSPQPPSNKIYNPRRTFVEPFIESGRTHSSQYTSIHSVYNYYLEQMSEEEIHEKLTPLQLRRNSNSQRQPGDDNDDERVPSDARNRDWIRLGLLPTPSTPQSSESIPSSPITTTNDDGYDGNDIVILKEEEEKEEEEEEHRQVAQIPPPRQSRQAKRRSYTLRPPPEQFSRPRGPRQPPSSSSARASHLHQNHARARSHNSGLGLKPRPLAQSIAELRRMNSSLHHHNNNNNTSSNSNDADDDDVDNEAAPVSPSVIFLRWAGLPAAAAVAAIPSPDADRHGGGDSGAFPFHWPPPSSASSPTLHSSAPPTSLAPMSVAPAAAAAAAATSTTTAATAVARGGGVRASSGTRNYLNFDVVAPSSAMTTTMTTTMAAAAVAAAKWGSGGGLARRPSFVAGEGADGAGRGGEGRDEEEWEREREREHDEAAEERRERLSASMMVPGLRLRGGQQRKATKGEVAVVEGGAGGEGGVERSLRAIEKREEADGYNGGAGNVDAAADGSHAHAEERRARMAEEEGEEEEGKARTKRRSRILMQTQTQTHTQRQTPRQSGRWSTRAMEAPLRTNVRCESEMLMPVPESLAVRTEWRRGMVWRDSLVE